MLTDAGYGVDTTFRGGLTELGLPYIVGIQPSTSLWPPKDVVGGFGPSEGSERRCGHRLAAIQRFCTVTKEISRVSESGH